MFWKFNFLESPSHIDSLLDRENVSLYDIMEEEDVLQECKAQNQKLIDFVSQTDKMMTMINLILTEPENQLEDCLKYKYSNTACDILTSDAGSINDQLVLDGHLVKLYDFLETEPPLNPLLASFFSKVMGVLITRKSNDIFEYLKAREDFVGSLLKHIDISAIMDLLLRLITCIESAETRLQVIMWLNDQNLIEKLVSRIIPKESEEVNCNASQSLCDIIRISRDRMAHMQENAHPDPLLATIESKEIISAILTNILDGERTEYTLVYGLAVIQNLLEFRKSNVESEPLTALDTERISLSLQNVLEAVQPRLAGLHSVLTNPPTQHYSVMETTAGVLDPPLGNTRIQLLRLINSLISTNMHEINLELTSLGTVNVIMDLFFKYEWNNFLHSQVEQCLCTILRTPATIVDDKNENPLLSQLLLHYRLLTRIIDAWEENETIENQNYAHRKGYMGHLTIIANDIHNLLHPTDTNQTDEYNLMEYVNQLSNDDKKRWNTFAVGPLADANNRSAIDTVPTSSNSDEDDDAFKTIPFQHDTALQQAFADYQLHQMTNNFLDQVGFSEEEFLDQHEAQVRTCFSGRTANIDFTLNAENDSEFVQKPSSEAIFERILESRIQQFDDESDEDDIWEEKEMTYTESTIHHRNRLFSTQQLNSQDEGSSDEDLDSLATIRQTVPSDIVEKMETESTESSALASVKPLIVPIAMDTANPWADAELMNGTSPQPDDQTSLWADFSTSTQNQDILPESQMSSTADLTNTTDAENFADFSVFEKSDLVPSCQESAMAISGSGDSGHVVAKNCMTLVKEDSSVNLITQNSDICSNPSSSTEPTPCDTAQNGLL